MSKLNFTPGPLQPVLQDEDTSEKWYDIWDATYGSVAHLSETARSDEVMRFLKGDAYLFSAAPDLYEACKLLCDAADIMNDGPDDSDKALAASRLSEAIQAAIRAKRKADGK